MGSSDIKRDGAISNEQRFIEEEGLAQAQDEEEAYPEGGYGWVIVLASSIVIFITAPFLSIFGLMYKETFNDLSRNATEPSEVRDPNMIATWTFLLYLTMWNLFSLVADPLLKLRSYRVTVLVGVLLMSAGVIFSSFAQHPADLYLTVGILVGAGQGLVTNPSILILTTYFKRKLGMVMGLLFAIMALGGIVTPLVTVALLSKLNLKSVIIGYGVYLLLAGLGALLLRPFREAEPEEAKGTCGAFHRLVDWSLLKSGTFWLLALGSAFGFTCIINFYLFLPLYSQTISLSSRQIAILLSVVSGVDLVSRMLFGVIGGLAAFQRRFRHPHRLLFACTGIGTGVAMIGLPFTSSFTQALLISILFGFFVGSVYVNGTLVYNESYPRSVASALGIACMLRSVAALIMGPIIDYFKSTGTGEKSSVWFCGSLLIAFMLAWLFQECLITMNNKSKREAK